MSTDQQPVSHDPRYDGIYQRGGAGATRQPEATATRHVPLQTPSRSPRQTEPDERPAGGQPSAVFVASTSSGSESYPPSERRLEGHGAAPQEPSPIREVGAPPQAPEANSPAWPRNPFDMWIWVVAAVLTSIGLYLTAAPALFERAMMEAQASGVSSSMTGVPWYHYTGMAAPPLILLGVGTAVVQLFILSLRHTLRSR